MKALLSNAILCLASVVLFVGCTKDRISGETPGKGQITVNFSMEQLSSLASQESRASVAASADENVVNEACLIFYNQDDTYAIHNVSAVSTSGASAGSFNISLPASLVEGNTYKVLVVANYNRFVANGMGSTDNYVQGLKSKKYTEMKSVMVSQATSRINTPLPLFGESSLVVPAKGASNVGMSVSFKRSVSRFDLSCKSPKLDIKWIKVCNYRTKGTIFHNDAPAGSIEKGTSTTTKPSDVGVVAPSGAVGAQSTTGGLYAYSNIVAYPVQNDDVTTSLMIAGVYLGDDPNNKKVTYYRVNVAGVQSSQSLKINHLYKITINNATAPGGDTEDQGMSNADSRLDFDINDWQVDDNAGIITDDKGNYLSISRTSLILDSSKGIAATIKVGVKSGATWKAEWVDNPENAFVYDVVDPTSLRVVTAGQNSSPFTNNAKLRVTLNGAVPALYIDVAITQLSTVNEVPMLMVNGKVGTFDVILPGQGIELSYQVLTGSVMGAWAATTNNDLGNFSNLQTPTGAHKGYLNLSVFANTTGATRTGTLTVVRNPVSGTAPVVVNFTQPKSPYNIAVSPAELGSHGVIDGFSRVAGNPNGVANQTRYQIVLADPTKYTWRVTSSYPGTDLYLGTTVNSSTVLTQVIGESGSSFFINVFRTGPGDPDIKGNLRIEAVAKVGGAVHPDVITLPLTITTSCETGNAKVGSLTWFDRNSGAPLQKDVPKSKNFTTAYPTLNKEWKGDLMSWNQATTGIGIIGGGTIFPCQESMTDGTTGWRLPTNPEQETVVSAILYSKNRAFVVSDLKTVDQRFIGCYFPLAGSIAEPGIVRGCYWSSDFNNSGGNYGGYHLSVFPSSSSVTFAPPTFGHSVRCVK